MSEETKNKRDKLTDSPIIFTENDNFSGEIESGFQHVGGKKNWNGSSSVEYSPGSLMCKNNYLIQVEIYQQ